MENFVREFKHDISVVQTHSDIVEAIKDFLYELEYSYNRNTSVEEFLHTLSGSDLFTSFVKENHKFRKVFFAKLDEFAGQRPETYKKYLDTFTKKMQESETRPSTVETPIQKYLRVPTHIQSQNLADKVNSFHEYTDKLMSMRKSISEPMEIDTDTEIDTESESESEYEYESESESEYEYESESESEYEYESESESEYEYESESESDY